METSFSSHAPCPKIIARAALAQPSPPLTNLPCWWELAVRHFSLGIVLLLFSLSHPPRLLFFFFPIFSLFFLLCMQRQRALGQRKVWLHPWPPKFSWTFSCSRYGFSCCFQPQKQTSPQRAEPFKGSRWLMRRKVVGRRMQMILDVFAIFISSRPCSWGNASSNLACCRLFLQDHPGFGCLMRVSPYFNAMWALSHMLTKH